jgi:hypothetical protein
MSVPANMKILCPVCAQARQQAVAIQLNMVQIEARCHECTRRFRVLTREVVSVDQSPADDGRTRYKLFLKDVSGDTTTKVFTAQPLIHLQPGNWVTLVYDDAHIAGIADQNTNRWYAITRTLASKKSLPWFWRTFNLLVLVLAAFQTSRLLKAVRHSSSVHGGAVTVGVIALVVLLLTPPLLWVVSELRGD